MGVPAWPWGSLQSSVWFCGNDVEMRQTFLMALPPLSPHVSGTSGVPSSPCHPCGSPRVAQPGFLPVSLFPMAFLGGLTPSSYLASPQDPSPTWCFGVPHFWGSPWWGGAPHVSPLGATSLSLTPSLCPQPAFSATTCSPWCTCSSCCSCPASRGPACTSPQVRGSPGGAGLGQVGWAAGGLPPPPPQAPSLQFHPGWAAWLRVEPLSVNYSPAGLLIALLLQDGHFGALLTTNLRAQGWAVRAHHEQPLRPAWGVAVAAGGHPHRGRWARGARSPPVPGSDPAPSAWHGHS